MTPYKKRMNPHIQRMVGDMQLRNWADATIDAYTYHVDKFCQFFGKPADQLGPEEIRQYQLYLVNEKKTAIDTITVGLPGFFSLSLLFARTSMPDKLEKQGRQMATGKSEGCIVPLKPGNSGGGKAAEPSRGSYWASSGRRAGIAVLTRAVRSARLRAYVMVGSRMR